MEHVFFLCFFGSFLVPFGADGQSTGQINIQNCTDGSLDIRENENNTIVCNAFGSNTTIAWFIRRSSNTKELVATCGPSNCTVYLPTHYAALRFPEESHLFYQQHDVSRDSSAQIVCETQEEEYTRSISCNFNVINPATLSDCVVEEDRRNGTVEGSCRFRNALSLKRGLTCKWHQENTEQSPTSYTGAVTVTSTTDGGHQGGQCTLSSKGQTWDKAPYSYNVDFYPGNGLHAVHTVKQDGQSTGQIHIQNCTGGLLDIRENVNNTIVCNAFGSITTIAWFIRRNYNTKELVASCGPSSCTVYLPTRFSALRFPTESHLFYQQHNVSEDSRAQIFCETQQEEEARSSACNFNVINPATLSDCVVEEDRRNGTVKGRCRFRNALSLKRGLTCTWHQENTEQSRTSYTGAVTVTSTTDGGHQGGQCTLSSKGHTWDKAPYSYNVDFYPGNGLHAVHTVKQGDGLTRLTSSTNQDVTSTTMSAITVVAESTSVPDGGGQVTSIAVIVGGCAGGGVVTVVVVVIVVIVIKRREGTYAKPRRRRNATDEHVYADLHSNATTTATAPPSGSTETTTNDRHNDSHNEHHNPVYVNDTDSGSPNAPDYYNQVTKVNSALQQNPTYENELFKTNHAHSGDDCSPYYSEIKNIDAN